VGKERKGVYEQIDAGWVAERQAVCIVSDMGITAFGKTQILCALLY